MGRAAMTLAVLLAALGGCREAHPDARVQATYDDTGKLRLLTYDSTGNAKPDTWTYMDGARVLRVEIDKNEDGVVDVVSTTTPGRRSRRSRVRTRPDGKVTRTEFYDGGVLARAEEDVDGNGAVDRWETYAEGLVRSVAFDLEGAGRPTRRLVYGSDGQLVQIETGRDLARRRPEAMNGGPVASPGALCYPHAGCNHHRVMPAASPDEPAVLVRMSSCVTRAIAGETLIIPIADPQPIWNRFLR